MDDLDVIVKEIEEDIAVKIGSDASKSKQHINGLLFAKVRSASRSAWLYSMVFLDLWWYGMWYRVLQSDIVCLSTMLV